MIFLCPFMGSDSSRRRGGSKTRPQQKGFRRGLIHPLNGRHFCLNLG